MIAYLQGSRVHGRVVDVMQPCPGALVGSKLGDLVKMPFVEKVFFSAQVSVDI